MTRGKQRQGEEGWVLTQANHVAGVLFLPVKHWKHYDDRQHKCNPHYPSITNGPILDGLHQHEHGAHGESEQDLNGQDAVHLSAETKQHKKSERRVKMRRAKSRSRLLPPDESLLDRLIAETWDASVQQRNVVLKLNVQSEMVLRFRVGRPAGRAISASIKRAHQAGGHYHTCCRDPACCIDICAAREQRREGPWPKT